MLLGAGQAGESREKIRNMDDVLGARAGLDHAGPTNESVDADAAFEVLGLAAAIDPVGLAALVNVLHEGAVVAHDHDNRVLGDAELFDLVEDLADPAVDLDDRLRNGAAVEGLRLLDVAAGERQRVMRPVLQEEGLVSLCQAFELSRVPSL